MSIGVVQVMGQQLHNTDTEFILSFNSNDINEGEETEAIIEYSYNDVIFVELYHRRSEKRAFAEAIYSDAGLFVNWIDFLDFSGFAYQETAPGIFELQLGNGNGVVRADFPGSSIIREANGEELAQNDDMARVEEAYFISERLLKQLFDLSIDFNRNRLVIEIEAQNLFPYEIIEQRERRRSRLNQTGRPESYISYEEIHDRYRFIDIPFLDIYSRSYMRSSGQDQDIDYNASYSIQGSGDIGFLNSEWSLRSRNAGQLDHVQFKAGRRTETPGFLGIGPTSFYLGDISSPRISGIANGNQGRGVEIGNFPLQRSRNFTSTELSGRVQPEWEVELYKGRKLIDFTETGESGEYRFTDVALDYGQNSFRIIAYGPQGQTEERTVNRYVGRDMIRPGKIYYSASFSQQGTPLFDPDPGSTLDERQGRPRIFTELETGFNSTLSAHAWVYSIPLSTADSRQHTYLASGLRTTLGKAGLQGSFIKDLDSGHAFRGELQTKLFRGWRLSGSYIRMYNKFVTEADFGTRRFYQGKARLSISGRLPLSLRTSFRLSDYRFDNGRYNTRLMHSLQRTFFGIRLTNNLNATLRHNNNYATRSSGSFKIRYKINSSLTRHSELKYEVKPERKVREINTAINWRARTGFNVQMRAGRRFADINEVWFGTASAQRHLGNFRVGLSARYDTGNRFSAGLSISTSLARNPVNNRIRAYRRPITRSAGFATNIYNEVPDANISREGIENAKLLISGPGRNLEADENGMIFSTNLKSWHPIEISLDESTLRDPAMVPPAAGLSYLSRPGKIFRREIQIEVASELDGIVYQADRPEQEDNLRVVSEVPVVLFEVTPASSEADEAESSPPAEELEVQRVETVFDGYYFFDRLEKGRYRVEVDAEWLEERNLRMLTDTEVFDVKGDGTIFRDADIVLTPIVEEIDFEKDTVILVEREREELRKNLTDQGLPLVCGENIDSSALYDDGEEQVVNPEVSSLLQQHANLMLEYPELRIFIEAYADQTDGRLGARRRTEEIRQALTNMGIEPDRIVTRNQSENSGEEQDILVRYNVFEMLSFVFNDPSLTNEQREKLAMDLDILHICPDVDIVVGASSDYLGDGDEPFSVVKQRRKEVLEFYIDQGVIDSRLEINMGVGKRYELPNDEGTNDEQGLAASLKADRQHKTYTIQLSSSETVENAIAQMRSLSEVSGRSTTIYRNPETGTYIITVDIEGSVFLVERELYGLRRDIQFRSAFLRPIDGLEEIDTGTEGLYEVRFGAFSSDEAAERVRDYINSFSSEEAVVVYNERDDVYRVIARNALERDEAVFIIDEARENGHNDLLILRLNELE